jgi:hypothetical protein
MAVPESPIVGVDLKMQYDDTLVGTQTDSNLSISRDLKEIIVKNTADGTPTDWKSRLSGIQEWEASHEGLVLGQNEGKGIADPNTTIEFELDTSDDGTDNASFVELKKVESMDFTLTQEIAQTGGLSDPLWRYVRPAERDWTADITAQLFDEQADAGATLKALRQATQNGTSVPMRLTVLGKEFEGKAAIGDVDRTGATGGEMAQIEMSLASDDPLTVAGTPFDSSVAMMFDAFMQKNELNVGMLHYDQSGPISGATKITGSGFLTEAAISLERGEPVTMSSTVAGNGPLTFGTIS